MGFVARDELLAFLNELLEAERVSARITARTVVEADDPDMVSMMEHVHSDESRWCAMLLRWIHDLGGEPAPNIGDIYERCFAYPDLAQRAAFINRGQGWVARKLCDMLPKIQNDSLRADLSNMLKCHEDNVDRTKGVPSP